MFRSSNVAIAAFAVLAVVMACAAVVGISGPLRLWIRSSAFTPVPGAVVASEVRERVYNSRAVSYLHVEYEYAALGRLMRSNRVTVDDDSSLAGGFVSYWQPRLTIGAPVRVWTAGANPAEALLDRRLPGPLFAICIGAAMFAGMALVFVTDAVDAIVWRGRRLAAGVVVRPQDRGAILHIPAYPSVAIGGFAVFLAAMIVCSAWLIAMVNRGDPFFPAWYGVVAVAAVLIPGPVAVFYECHLARSGRRDLIVDEAMKNLLLPPGPNRRGPCSIPLASIEDVDVVTWEHPVQTQHGTTTVYTYVPTVVYRSELGGWRNQHILEWRDSGKAHTLAKWLRGRICAQPPKVGAGGVGLGGERLGSILEGIEPDPSVARQ